MSEVQGIKPDSTTAIILVEPENPDNIGAVARAMKNMGLKDLRLVKPPPGWFEKGKKMAMSAKDTLEQASVFQTVKEAIHDRHLVIGTTRRGGPRRGFFMPFRDAVSLILERNGQGDLTALMFGRESKGLDNQSLSLCNWVTTIPVHPAYPSINLAQAVMILGFKLFEATAGDADIRQYQRLAAIPKRGRKKAQQENGEKKEKSRYLSKEELHTLLDRFEGVLKTLNYERKGGEILPRIKATFHGLLKRSGLLESEAQMFRGIARRISERVTKENE